jgi:hypothetical protein
LKNGADTAATHVHSNIGTNPALIAQHGALGAAWITGPQSDLNLGIHLGTSKNHLWRG